MDRSQEILEFLPTIQVTQGEGAGSPMRVLPWEEDFCRGAFADGISQASLTIARGNGKSTLVAALAAAHLGPLVQPRADIVCVASSFLQGQIIFGHVKEFLRPRIEADPKDWQIRDSQNSASLMHRPTGSTVRCLGSDPRRAHGIAAALILCDEIAQWVGTTSAEMFGALRTSLGKIPDSKLIAIGTMADDPSHFFNKRFEGQQSGYHQKHAANKDADVSDRDVWIQANPSLPYMPALRAMLETEYEDALRDPGLMATFRALRLNQGVGATLEEMILEAGIWESIEDDYLEPEGQPIWGIDLGSGHSMSAIVCVHPNGVLQALAAFPARPDLKDRGRTDGCADLYLQMAYRGELILSGDMVVDIPDFFMEALARFGAPAAIVCDRWRDKELLQFLTNSQFPVCPLITRGMGFKDGSSDLRTFRRACLDGQVSPRVSLTMRSALASARTISDPAGNQKLSKSTQGGRRKASKDDVLAGAILAVAEMVRHQETIPQPSRIYHGIA